MKLNIVEKVGYGQIVSVQETNDMKLKCSFCKLQFGNAVKTDNLYIRTYEGRDYLVCQKHLDCKIVVKGDSIYVLSKRKDHYSKESAVQEAGVLRNNSGMGESILNQDIPADL